MRLFFDVRRVVGQGKGNRWLTKIATVARSAVDEPNRKVIVAMIAF